MMEYLGVIIAIVGSTLSMVGVMLALFLWNRGEANSDRRHHLDTADSLRQDINKLYGKLNKIERRR